MKERQMKVANEVWVATALLHSERPEQQDFSIKEIKARAREESWGSILRPGFMHHASYHCLANKPPNNVPHRMLFETDRGRRRLFRSGDTFHPERVKGIIRPHEGDLLPRYRHLLDWYEAVYSKQPPNPPTAASASVSVPHQFPPKTEARETSLSDYEEMQATTAFVGPGGTIVLPGNLQRDLNLKEGSCLSVYREKNHIVLFPVTEEFVHSLRGSCKGDDSLVEAREREHRDQRY